MGWNVHIHLCFPCDSNEAVAALALKHLPSLADNSDGERAAIWFLEDLSKRTGGNRGPKGGLSLWGMVGNYTKVDTFCEVLRQFWRDLYDVDGGPLTHERIVVFEEQEQSRRPRRMKSAGVTPKTSLAASSSFTNTNSCHSVGSNSN